MDPHLRAELERHHRDAYGWALACCDHDPDLAEDVLQTTYLKVLEGKARYDGRAAFRTWLFAVIRNTAIDALRRRRTRRLSLRRLALRQPPDAHVLPEDDAALGHEEAERFRALLKRLPARQREVLHLVFYHDLTIAEAARVMGVGLGSARTHYERGKQRLRQWLTPNEHEPERRSAP
ncbi:MAG: RNA polymerase sigma factor [Bacteroidetes bacterium]|nr:MAG: RNA polymerase sigma factor [Bacteroidota bacterium]